MVLAVVTLVSWVGEAVHNAVELPSLSLLSPENSLPAVVAASLLGAYLLLPSKRTAVFGLLSWGLLNLVGGGIISVLPLSFLPFHPEQSVGHYLMHVFYSMCEIPFILASMRLLKML